MTDEQRKRLSGAHIGKNIGHIVSEETRKKISESQKGKIIPIEQRLKISSSLQGRKMPYVAKSNSERVISVETRKLRSEYGKKIMLDNWSSPDFRENLSGKNSPHWIEDRSLLKVSDKKHLDSKYKEWMLSVKDRDEWKCKISNEDCEGRLEAHHILSWRDYPELRYQLNNGITLCRAHHPLKRAEEKRLVSEFQKLVSVSKD